MSFLKAVDPYVAVSNNVIMSYDNLDLTNLTTNVTAKMLPVKVGDSIRYVAADVNTWAAYYKKLELFKL